MTRARRGRRALCAIGVVLGAGLVAAACSSGTPPQTTVARSATTAGAKGWVDEQVSFQAYGMTVYGILRHPTDTSRSVPGVVLIAGSGPTDENGNSPEISGSVDTLKTLADWLSDDGVATLRYDKLGTGQTGLGPFATDPSAIGIEVYEQEAAAALRFLADQPGVDATKLGVIGHSEGALFALLVATGHAGAVPPVRAVGLLEPLSERYLTIISAQVEAQVTDQLDEKLISPQVATAVRGELAAAIASLRAHGTVKANLPYGLSGLLNPTTAKFLSEADKYDPATLGAQLGRGVGVLVSCSNADIQVSCAEVDHLVAGLRRSKASVTVVHLDGVDHVLKVDDSRSSTGYGKPLPFSPQLEAALRRFVAAHL